MDVFFHVIISFVLVETVSVTSTEIVLSVGELVLDLALILTFPVFAEITAGCVPPVMVPSGLGDVVVVCPLLDGILPIGVVPEEGFVLLLGAVLAGGVGLEVVIERLLLALRSDESVMVVLIIHCLFCHSDVFIVNVTCRRLL